MITFPELVRQVPALCPLWPRLQTLSSMCPRSIRPCVYYMAAPPNLCVHLGRAPCVRLVSALAAPPNLVQHLSAKCSALCLLWPPWPRPVCPPCVRLVPALYLPCVRLLSALAAPPGLVSALSPLLAFSLSSLCPLVVRSSFALCRLLSGCMVWLWPSLCQLCVRSLVFAPLFVLCPLLSASRSLYRLSLRLCPLFFFSHLLPAVLLSALERCRAFAPCLLFSPFVQVFCIFCLGFVYVFRCPDFYFETGHAVSLYSAGPGPGLNRLSLGLW